jgi:hypothetical protein
LLVYSFWAGYSVLICFIFVFLRSILVFAPVEGLSESDFSPEQDR